jgi:hypothetical protein
LQLEIKLRRLQWHQGQCEQRERDNDEQWRSDDERRREQEATARDANAIAATSDVAAVDDDNDAMLSMKSKQKRRQRRPMTTISRQEEAQERVAFRLQEGEEGSQEGTRFLSHSLVLLLSLFQSPTDRARACKGKEREEGEKTQEIERTNSGRR